MIESKMTRREREFWEKQPMRPSPGDKSRLFKHGKRGGLTSK